MKVLSPDVRECVEGLLRVKSEMANALLHVRDLHIDVMRELQARLIAAAEATKKREGPEKARGVVERAFDVLKTAKGLDLIYGSVGDPSYVV